MHHLSRRFRIASRCPSRPPTISVSPAPTVLCLDGLTITSCLRCRIKTETPKYITISIFPNNDRSGVRPVERPTVPKADLASNSKRKTGKGSVKVSTRVTRKIKPRARRAMDIVRATSKTGISLAKAVTYLLPLEWCEIARVVGDTEASKDGTTNDSVPWPAHIGTLIGRITRNTGATRLRVSRACGR